VLLGAPPAPVPFAHNILEIAVPPGNPGKVTGLADLARSDVSVALCATSVPCGSLAHTIADRAGLTVTPVTEEPTVKAVLTKVELGEVDAGVVFVTDVRTAGDKVVGVPIPEEANEATTYPIVTLDDAANAALADEFLAYVLSSDGQAVLAGVGFTSP
jgi:molybdate transport system substrate-binding protein